SAPHDPDAPHDDTVRDEASPIHHWMRLYYPYGHRRSGHYVRHVLCLPMGNEEGTMGQADTVTLFINEAGAGAAAGDLEKNIGGIDGVRAVELGTPDAESDDAPLMVHRATITYDHAETTPRSIREQIQNIGYTVTMLSDVGD
nr:hypothetical protein [Chloroflexota bacterium]